MPSPEALDSMSRSIAGCDWEGLKYPEHRIQIMTLALADERNAILDVIEGHLGEIPPELKKMSEKLEELGDYASHVSLWFEKSKLWEGRLL